MNSVTERLSAALADRYRIERELGAGGMATVYLAQDLKHDRLVAVKVLKPELAAVLGAERFVVEIKTTASMSHPHILPLFDSGTADGFLFYVMPYVEGETLRDKLNRETQLDIDEAVRIAREVLDALDYAHGRGVIHRDIKPENILMQGGRPMVADFGIALAVSAAAGGRMTETGLSLGTPHYMSPEQATAEKEITGRADIYSLASVLYEMLTGEPPHMGNSAQQIIMKIITEPAAAVTKYRKSVPANVASAVAKALEKLPADRFASAKGFADALANTTFTTVQSSLAGQGGGGARWTERVAMPLAAALVLALVGAVWGWSRPSGASDTAGTMRMPITLPDSAPLRRQGGILLALSEDGTRLIYVGAGEGDVDLFERPLNSLSATRIPDTNGADSPFLSPDGNTVGFYRANPARLFTVSLRGGPRLTWAEDSTISWGGDFGPDGAVYFTRLRGIRRVREAGGAVEQVTSVDSTRGERGHAWVDVLPNGKGAIFTVLRADEEQHDIAAVDFESGEVRTLVRGVYARFVAPGRLLYVDARGGLFAMGFDEGKLATTGPAIPVIGGIGLGENGVAHVTFSASGAMLYAVGSGSRVSERLSWLSREGSATPVDTSLVGRFDEVALSPDGRRVAVGVNEGILANIWIKDLPTGPVQKLTLEGDNYGQSWSADGRTIFFISVRPGIPGAVYSRPTDGSANARLVFAHSRNVAEAKLSRDGEWMVFGSGADLFARRMRGDTTVIQLTSSATAEITPRLSPDGRWLAYLSTESGTPEIYVSPFPDFAASRVIVSQGGGTEPVWSADGRELFYATATGTRIVAAKVETSPTFRVLERRVLFVRQGLNSVLAGGSYDVTPDGKRFLMYGGAERAEERFVLVLNWAADLDGARPK